MDRVFLEYYENELVHLRGLAEEFSALHPAVARNLSLDTVPCPDPYVERLLEGVAFLAARTRLKVDGESSRFSRNILDALYPDLVGPAPAMSTAILHPGPQVQTMISGHCVKRRTRMVTGLKEGIQTRCTYTTAQDVTLWPVAVTHAEYLQDRGALDTAGISTAQREGAECGLRLQLARTGDDSLSELELDELVLHFCKKSVASALFDSIFGSATTVLARNDKPESRFHPCQMPQMVGIADSEALLPRSRPTFEGYRLLREYFLMPERFHYVRLAGLGPMIKTCTNGALEIIILLSKDCSDLADVNGSHFALNATPVVNLFERECNIIDLDTRRSQQVLHADRTRPRDFEIYLITHVEDAENDGPDAQVPALFSLSQNRGSGVVYSTERRPRRPGEDEIRRGQTRSSYRGDDMFISISRPPASTTDGPAAQKLRRLDIRALVTNRDLAILEDNPTLILESGDPVAKIELLTSMLPPRSSLPSALPRSMRGESRQDDLSWRLVGQLSLNFLSLAEECENAEPLRALLDLYADRGNPALSRHVRSLTKVTSQPVVERLAIEGPMCFGHGVEITLHVDENTLAGHSTLLLSSLLSHLFARHAGVNSFIRTQTRLLHQQEEIQWPITIGNRCLI